MGQPVANAQGTPLILQSELELENFRYCGINVKINKRKRKITNHTKQQVDWEKNILR